MEPASRTPSFQSHYQMDKITAAYQNEINEIDTKIVDVKGKILKTDTILENPESSKGQKTLAQMQKSGLETELSELLKKKTELGMGYQQNYNAVNSSYKQLEVITKELEELSKKFEKGEGGPVDRARADDLEKRKLVIEENLNQISKIGKIGYSLVGSFVNYWWGEKK